MVSDGCQNSGAGTPGAGSDPQPDSEVSPCADDSIENHSRRETLWQNNQPSIMSSR
jgi:hypothetical protein